MATPPPPPSPPPHDGDVGEFTVDDDDHHVDEDSASEDVSGRPAGSKRATPPRAQRGRGRGTGGTASKSKKKKRDSSSVTTHTHARTRACACVPARVSVRCVRVRVPVLCACASASTRLCARVRLRRCVRARVRVPCACASTRVCARVQRLVRVRRCARVHVCVGWCLTSRMLVCATAQTPKVYPVDSEEGTKVRREACRKLIQENNCRSEGTDADMKDRYYGWRPLPMQAAQIGGVVPREMKYGVVCEPFLPSNPFGKVDNPDHRKWFCCCHDECKQVYVFKSKNRSSIYDHCRSTHAIAPDTSAGRGLGNMRRQETVSKATVALEKLGPNRLADINKTRAIIRMARPFHCVENEAEREDSHPDWIPCSAETMRKNVGEMFLEGSKITKQKIQNIVSSACLPPLRLESDVEDDGGCDEEGVEVTEVADVVGW